MIAATALAATVVFAMPSGRLASFSIAPTVIVMPMATTGTAMVTLWWTGRSGAARLGTRVVVVASAVGARRRCRFVHAGAGTAAVPTRTVAMMTMMTWAGAVVAMIVIAT
jgi:hypothetical protein